MKNDEEHRSLFPAWVNVLRQAKEYLSQKGRKFQERDIAQDSGALADLKKLGYMTTPVIVIDVRSSLDSTQRRLIRRFRVS